MLLSLSLTACRLSLEVPPGGQINTDFNSYDCVAGEVCTCDVIDDGFVASFQAKPDTGMMFLGRQRVDKSLCGGTNAECALSTDRILDNPVLVALLQSGGEFFLKPVIAAGRRVYELTDCSGRFYLMQSFRRAVEKNLHITDLKYLDSRLQLPQGWMFRSYRLQESFDLVSVNGIAEVVTEDLGNTYQYIPE